MLAGTAALAMTRGSAPGSEAASTAVSGSTAVAQVGAAPAALPAADPGTPSFFDPFDRLDTQRWYISDGWVNGDHQGCTWSRSNVAVSRGMLQLVLGKATNKLRDYGCAEVRTVRHLGYGTYEGRLRTAAGSGLNTAMFTYSNEARDELDFEFLGRQPGNVQLNYWQTGRGGHETLPALGFDSSAGFNDYALVWAPDSAKWYVNGRLVREAHGADLPRVAGSLILSLWNGSAEVDGWLGRFDASRTPVLAEFDWVGFTRAGEKCRFPESITCRLPQAGT